MCGTGPGGRQERHLAKRPAARHPAARQCGSHQGRHSFPGWSWSGRWPLGGQGHRVTDQKRFQSQQHLKVRAAVPSRRQLAVVANRY